MHLPRTQATRCKKVQTIFNISQKKRAAFDRTDQTRVKVHILDINDFKQFAQILVSEDLHNNRIVQIEFYIIEDKSFK